MTAATATAACEVAAPYAVLDAAERYIHETRDRALFALLSRRGIDRLDGLRILELGCGEGALMRTLRHHGADRVAGVEIDRGRAARAGARAPVAVADATRLPYRDGSFDLAFAFTVLSAIRDRDGRRFTVEEAMRALRPGGLLVIYDFWINPLNRRARPLGVRELRDLAGPRSVEIERVTLAPPIVRLLRGRAWLCAPLERATFLRTHHLTAIAKES